MPKLYIISGHGNGDCGAVGNGYQEYERVRALAQRIKDFGGDNVMLHPFDDNAYASNAISKLNISKDYCIVELHMDSSSGFARGGHVIIYGEFNADKYDTALANFIGDMFQGRSQTIVKRIDLLNLKRAASRGYNYRLLECCFITNADDIAKFNANIDDIAKGILGAFGIDAGANVPTATPVTSSKPATSSTSSKADISVDGLWGKATTKALQKVLGTVADGIVSNQSSSDFAKVNKGGLLTSSWKTGHGGSMMIKAIQKKVGAIADGYFGKNTCKALQRYLGTTADGYVSKPSAMVKELQRRLNAGTF